MDWIVVAGLVWMFLVAAVIFLALCRISTAMTEEKLARAGLPVASRIHAQLLHVIQSEDRAGIALTAVAFICSVFLALMLADRMLPGGIHKLVQILILSVQ